ncbi:MAG: hypothetical protein MRY79_08665 [Alphaproteobacteria bacterium]|nr:hypothetical protein [Alphaproteobacteria bacterium]
MKLSENERKISVCIEIEGVLEHLEYMDNKKPPSSLTRKFFKKAAVLSLALSVAFMASSSTRFREPPRELTWQERLEQLPEDIVDGVKSGSEAASKRAKCAFEGWKKESFLGYDSTVYKRCMDGWPLWVP